MALGRVGVEEVAEQGKEMLVFKGAFGKMKVAGVQDVFCKGEGPVRGQRVCSFVGVGYLGLFGLWLGGILVCLRVSSSTCR